MQPIIRVQGLGKQYQLGGARVPYSTLRESLMDLARRPVRALRRNGNESTTLWAVKDLDFEVAPGEIVGIIGRNGAGKSTLLKILSRITEPTLGRVELYGRVASLLEVGTGFHPELTGRENIYLNGSILGMARREIEQKFDEIVAFSEVEKFLDTPVKRYSSGMYVRLAFAVAAHLQPEILVVDEVLAVGDYAFQQKCLNKMQDVSTGGRTVLFVSHNMGAISRLCQRCIVLDKGQIVSSGPTAAAVQTYMTSGLMERAEFTQSGSADKAVNLLRIALVDENGEVRSEVPYDGSLRFNLEYEVSQSVNGTSVGIALFTVDGTCVLATGDFDAHPELLAARAPGRYRATVEIPPCWLNTGRYTVTVYIANATSGVVYDQLEVIVFSIVDTGTPGSRHGVSRKGVLQPILDWTTTPASK
ncbi:MAG TPA: ABC transporter ATP-binding protein [Pyrinomonadaceae bacterium]|nr:ABC transporter ATP-binding protein [Pyrinomonadaceae bacterium]